MSVSLSFPAELSLRLRAAAATDLDVLFELEFAAFTTDRISRRSWQDLLASPSASIFLAAQYFMYADRWQIIRHSDGAPPREGKTEAVAVADIPDIVKDAALAAARLVGEGPYGSQMTAIGRCPSGAEFGFSANPVGVKNPDLARGRG